MWLLPWDEGFSSTDEYDTAAYHEGYWKFRKQRVIYYRMNSAIFPSHRNPVFWLIGLLFLSTSILSADQADFNRNPDYAQVKEVRMLLRSDGTWDIHVAVLHNDQGWDHYADRWQILDDTTGEVLAERILAHPHDTEQPFTRSLSRISLPESTRIFRIRASCEQHGFGGREIVVEIPGDPTRGVFTVIRTESTN